MIEQGAQQRQRQRQAALKAAQLLLLTLVLGALLWDTAHTIPIDLNKLPDELGDDYERDDSDSNNNDGDIQMIDAETKSERSGGGEGLVQNVKKFWSKLPKYFDFDQFKRKFKRTYKSSEDFIRKSIFLRNTLEVFKWRVSYRIGASKYLREVNKFSDRTVDEQRKLFMTNEPPKNDLMLENYIVELRKRKNELELASKLNVGIETESQCARGSDDELCFSNLLTSEQQASKLIEKMFLDYQQEGSSEQFMGVAILEELREFGFESESQMASSEQEGLKFDLWPGGESEEEFAKRIASIPKASVESSDTHMLEAFDQSLDWSKHECFHEVYDQGNDCGKCYVLAATALAEFYKCSEAGPGRKWTKRKFSKDYLLDCGQKFSPTLMGCAGGSPLDALRFLIHSGANNIRDWRAKKELALQMLRHQYGPALSNYVDSLDLKCPLNEAELPMQEWGNQKLKLRPISVDVNHWQAALQDGPLIVWLQMPTEGFLDYSSGVHDGGDCARSGAYHAMLLVGYGWDSNGGQTYWRFRNSFGPDWGDSGHFNLDQQVSSACLTGGVRVFRT